MLKKNFENKEETYMTSFGNIDVNGVLTKQTINLASLISRKKIIGVLRIYGTANLK